MKQLTAAVFAAIFATASLAPVAFAADKADKKPTAEQCKKDPKLKGCEQAKK